MQSSISSKPQGAEVWYSDRASTYKQRTQLLGLLVIGAGGATCSVQVLALPWVPVLTAALGAVVVFIAGRTPAVC
jgi:hypothetical protein